MNWGRIDRFENSFVKLKNELTLPCPLYSLFTLLCHHIHYFICILHLPNKNLLYAATPVFDNVILFEISGKIP